MSYCLGILIEYNSYYDIAGCNSRNMKKVFRLTHRDQIFMVLLRIVKFVWKAIYFWFLNVFFFVVFVVRHERGQICKRLKSNISDKMRVMLLMQQTKEYKRNSEICFKRKCESHSTCYWQTKLNQSIYFQSVIEADSNSIKNFRFFVFLNDFCVFMWSGLKLKSNVLSVK